MKLVAIILNYNTAELTLRAMNSAVEALAAIEITWKLLVIDNCSTDGSGDIIARQLLENKNDIAGNWEFVDFIQSPVNGGYGAGNNIGIRKYLESEEQPDFFYILNSDAFPQTEAVNYLLKEMENCPDCGIAGSYIYGVDGIPHGTAFRFPGFLSEIEGSIRLGYLTRALKNHVVPLGPLENTQKVDWVAGASLLVRSVLLKEVGIFDEEFFLYFEETDLCRRAQKSGWDTIYVRESQVAHVGSASTGIQSTARVPQYWFDSRRHYFRKNHGTVYFLLSTLARIAGESIFKLRVVIEKKQDANPKYFIRDLLKHTWGSIESNSSNKS